MSFENDLKKLEKKLDYKGCRNCTHQISPLCMCEWAEKKENNTSLHLICPKWEHRREHGA